MPDAAARLAARRSTVLGFDFGTRWIGVAVGDPDTRIAHPVATIEAISARERFDRIAALIDEWQPGLLVVGEPANPDGGTNPLAPQADRFSRQLGGRFRLPVHRVDERYSSAEASAQLADRGRGSRADRTLVHAMAARIILEAYFNDQPA